MGDLPPSRVMTPSRPFMQAGVDYAGPIQLKTIQGRTSRCFKGYIALFVCMATKAVHIETVSDLTSEAFIAAFRRFVSRRGLPSMMFSDNGTNFVGAYSELKELRKLVCSSKFNSEVADHLSSDGVQWKFQPPHAPNFGGLWEAGVKSVKQHLRRVLSDTTLTFEQMSTLLCQIEAILNSRPLCALSEDVDDYDVLTPGHFLIGGPLITVPDPDLSLIQINRLSRWQFVQKMAQGFWKRWRQEYLTSLQQRSKWQDTRTNLEIGDLIILKDENLAPSKWALGRVTKSIAGSDGWVRVVEVKTKGGIYKRPISKICPLPIFKDNY